MQQRRNSSALALELHLFALNYQFKEKIYLRFQSLLKTVKLQVVEILPHGWWRSCLSWIVNTMVVDGLVTQGARSSAAMISIKSSQNILISAREGLINNHSFNPLGTVIQHELWPRWGNSTNLVVNGLKIFRSLQSARGLPVTVQKNIYKVYINSLWLVNKRHLHRKSI